MSWCLRNYNLRRHRVTNWTRPLPHPDQSQSRALATSSAAISRKMSLENSTKHKGNAKHKRKYKENNFFILALVHALCFMLASFSRWNRRSCTLLLVRLASLVKFWMTKANMTWLKNTSSPHLKRKETSLFNWWIHENLRTFVHEN